MGNVVIIRNKIIQNNGITWSTTINKNLSVINLEDKLKVTVSGERKEEVVEYLVNNQYSIKEISLKENNFYYIEFEKIP